MAYNVSVQAYGASTTLTVGGDTAPLPVVGSPSSVIATASGGSLGVGWDYATVTDDSLSVFLIYVGASATPDWGSAAEYSPDSITTHYDATVANDLSGTIYVAVRAVGDGVTSDSDVATFVTGSLSPPINLAIALADDAAASWEYVTPTSNELAGFKVYLGQDPEPNWAMAVDVGLADGDASSTSFAAAVPTRLKGVVYMAVQAYGESGQTKTADAIYGVRTPMDGKLGFAAADGLDLVYIAVVYFGGAVGTKYYTSRECPGLADIPWEVKLDDVPGIPRRTDPSAVRFDALNDDVTIRLRNSPEAEDGGYDSERIQDLMTEATLGGKLVDLGIADLRTLTTVDAIKWDGRYRIDRVERDNADAVLYCVDRMLHPGEKPIGSTINAGDWPVAPAESYSAVRGPVFGKVDTLPLVPVEVGMFATLASEIDDQDAVIHLSVGDMSRWSAPGFVEIGDEIVYYPVMDRDAKTLGSTTSGCFRGAGYPLTTAAAHANGATVREARTGREALLNGAHTSASTEISLQAGELLPPSGIVIIDNESIVYSSKTGSTLQGLLRGAPFPTIAKVHNIGTPVRTFPTGAAGNARYRYVVAEGVVSAISNLRVRDEQGNELPYSGGTATLSQVTAESGKVWSVVDLPARARFERFEESGSRVPQEWITETNGEVDAEGVATAASFLRWRATTSMSSDHVLTWPRAVDPNASTRAVIMEARPGSNVFSLQFDANWDAILNAPRQKYGRFKDARLRVRVQYDRQTNTPAVYQVHSNTLLVKAGSFLTPTLGGGTGDGTVSGQQMLPQSRWQTQGQTRQVRLSSRTTDAYSDASVAYWNDPVRVTSLTPAGPRADHTSATDGDTRSFVSGGYYHSGSPVIRTEASPGLDLGPLRLYSNDAFPSPASTDRLTALVVTIFNPTGDSIFTSTWWTGWRGNIYLYGTTDQSGSPLHQYDISIGVADPRRVIRIPLDGLTWEDLQSIRVDINQYFQFGFTVKGATVGDVSLAVEYIPDVEGQRIGTIVDGSYFRTTATTTPSAIYDQVISLGAIAKDLGRQYGADPWYLFSDVLGEGLKFSIILPTAGDGLRFAVADVFLELDYDALGVVYDGMVVADVDGVVAAPSGGGTDVLLENPVDIMAHLIDGADYFDMASARDAESWAAARTAAESVGWKMARAVVSEVPLREMLSSLCAESRVLLLAEGLSIYLRVKLEEATPVESVRMVGNQSDPALALVTDKVPVVNRLEDVFNSIGFYYRRNYVTGDFKAVIEESDQESQGIYGKRRTTLDLEWHQSSRGYTGGQPDQKWRLGILTGYVIDVAARLWDYATIELTASGAESLLRYDVVTLNYPRSGYYSSPGRLVSLQRLNGPMRWQAVLQLNQGTIGYIWQSAERPDTYIKLAEGATRMDFVIKGVLVAQLTSAGHWRIRGDVVNYPSSVNTSALQRQDTGSEIALYRLRRDGVYAGKYELLLWLDESGNMYVYSYGATLREIVAPATLLTLGGVAGIVDTATETETGELRFFLGNNLVAVVDDVGWKMKGNLVANLGTRMGSE